MSFKEYIDPKDNKKELIENMEILMKEYPKYKESTMKKFWELVRTKMQDRIQTKQWEIKFDNDKSNLINGKKYGYPHTFGVYDKDSGEDMVYFCMEYAEDDFKELFYGIITPVVSGVPDFDSEKIHGCYSSTKDIVNYSWWYNCKYAKINSNTENLFQLIVGKEERIAQDLVDEFMNYFKENEGVVKEVNKNPEKFKKG